MQGRSIASSDRWLARMVRSRLSAHVNPLLKPAKISLLDIGYITVYETQRSRRGLCKARNLRKKESSAMHKRELLVFHS